MVGIPLSTMFTKLVNCFIQLDSPNFYYYVKITVQRLKLSCLYCSLLRVVRCLKNVALSDAG